MLHWYVAITAPQSIPRGEIPITMTILLYQLLKTVQGTNYCSLPEKGEGRGGGWGLGNDYLTCLHRRSTETSLSYNYISPRLSDAHRNFYIVWQSEWAISFFIQTGVWKYKSTSLSVLFSAHLSKSLSAAL